jgi:hypothetical protein
MQNPFDNAPADIPERDRPDFEEVIAILKDVKLVTNEEGRTDFVEPGMLPFLQELRLGWKWAVALKYLDRDDDLRDVLLVCLDLLHEAGPGWDDELGRHWPMQQLQDEQARLVRAPDGSIASVRFPFTVDKAGNAIYPPDRTAERRASRHVTQAPDNPAGEHPTDGYHLFS